MKPSRTPYPTDVSDEEWAFVAPYLLLLPEDAGQRTYSLREVFNGLRWIARAGAPCAWTTRFRRLVRDYERLSTTLVGFHLIVFASLMLHQWLAISSPSQTLFRERRNGRR